MTRPLHPVFAALLLVFISLRSVFGADATESPILPAQQPMLVLRAASAEGVEKLFAAWQLYVMELDEFDASGPVPGLGSRLTSLRELLAGLTEKRARDIFFCLSGSAVSSTAAVGCTWIDDGATDVGAWLGEFFPGQEWAVEETDVARQRRGWVAAVNRQTLSELREGGRGKRDEEWRRDLERFMTGDPANLSLWLYPRPVLGALSLDSGIDFRAEAARYGLNIPPAIELRLTADTSIGMSFRLPRLFARPPVIDADDNLTVERGVSSLLRVHLVKPLAWLEAASIDTSPVAAANIDLKTLSPKTVCFDLWRASSGDLAWSVICVMDGGKEFQKQLERIYAWLDVFAASPATGLTVAKVAGSGVDGQRRITLGERSFVLGAIKADKATTYLVAADSMESFPDAGSVKTSNATRARLAEWTIDLDEQAYTPLAEVLERQTGGKIHVEAYQTLLNEEGAGVLRLDEDALTGTLRYGTSILTAAGFGLYARGRFAPLFDISERIHADRLRFLLDVCGQFRFRDIGPGRLRANPMPGSLDELLTADADCTDWLDTVFPDFPGHGLPPSRVLASLAEGAPLDGRVYRIDATDGTWFLIAQKNDGAAMRIDAAGVVMEKDPDGDWRPHFPIR